MKPSVIFAMMLLRGGEAVARAVLERIDVDLLAIDPNPALLAEEGIPCRAFADDVPKDVEQWMLPDALRRLECIAEVVEGPDFRDAFGHFDDTSWQRVKERLYDVLKRDFFPRMVDVEWMRNCAARNDVRLLVFSEDVLPSSRTLIETAKAIGIPSLQVMHSVPCGPKTAHPALTSTHLAVFSEHAGRLYESIDADPSRVAVTGNPAWDRLARPPRPGERNRLCGSLDLDPAQPVIVYSLTNSGSWSEAYAVRPQLHNQLTEAVLDAFTTLSRAHSEWQFGMRPRPGLDRTCPIDDLVARARGRGLKNVFVDRLRPYESVVLSDVVLSTESNMGIEAILLGKPAVNVCLEECGAEIFDEGFGPLYNPDDAVLQARTADAIAPAIEAALLDASVKDRLVQARARSIQRFNGENDGKAAQRVAELIVSLVEKGRASVPSVRRYPSFEHALARAVPVDADRVLVLGENAGYVADAIRVRGGHKSIETRPADPDESPTPADAVVLSEPVPPGDEGRKVLRDAADCVVPGGVLVAPFRNKATANELDPAGHPYGGLAVILSQAGWVLSSILPAREGLVRECVSSKTTADAEAWIVTAKRRSPGPGRFSQALRQRRRQADALNQRGETRFSEGDVEGAAADFTAAIGLWREEAVYFNNLGTALHAIGHDEGAWKTILEALHVDPDLESARENLRVLGNALGRIDEAETILRLFGPET